MTLRAALAALLIVSCADDAIWWELPPDMTDDERAAFGEGLELDNGIATRQQYIALPGEGNRRVFLRRPENMVREGATGEYGTGVGVMNLVRGQNHRTMVMVVAHEGLHALGVRGHVTGRGIMNANGLAATPDEPIAWTEEDKALCRLERACR